MNRPNMRDVSREAGVSVATVSRVINSSGHVTPATRTRVVEAVRRLGYRPPVQTLVGLIVPDSSNPFFARLAFEFEKEFSRRGFHLLVSSSEGRVDKEVELIDRFLRLQVRGIVYIASGSEPDGVIRLVADPDVPVVLFDREVGGANMDLVAIDSGKGTQAVVDYLLTLGHERIGYIQGPLTTPTGKSRYQAFLGALKAHGIRFEQSLAFSGDFGLESGRIAAGHMLRVPLRERPTAIVAANDLMAIGALRAILDKGLAIPRDMSVVGFDDIDIAAWVHPGLTTVTQPISRLVGEATSLMMERIEHPGRARSPRSIVIEPRLLVRESSGVPSSK